MWTDDPVADAERYFAEQEREFVKLPVCDLCRERIQTDYCYEIESGIYVCENCMDHYYRRNTTDLIA
jgi:hypothetical protein